MTSACRPARRQLSGPDTAMPMGGGDSGRSQTFADSTSKCLPAIGHRVAVPERADDLDRLLEHLVAHAGDGPPSADDVFVQVLARAEPEGEPTVGEQLHRRRLLRDDCGVIAPDRTRHVGHQRNALGRLGRRAEHAPRVRRVALGVQPREVVVADDREVETGFLGERDVAHQLLGTGLLAHHRVADQRHRVPPSSSSARVTTVRSWSPSPWSTTRCHSSAKQASAANRSVVGRLEREVHVLERERQRELR